MASAEVSRRAEKVVGYPATLGDGRSALVGGWLLQLTARPRLLQRRVRRTVV